MEVIVRVECPALERLAEALRGWTENPSAATRQPPSHEGSLGAGPAAMPVAPAPVTSPPPPPVEAVLRTTAPAPMPQAPAAPVPTQTVTYKIEDIMRAASAVADKGRRQDVLNLMGQFQIPTLVQLPPERFADFARALRGMGAQI